MATDFIVDYDPNERAQALGLDVLPPSWSEGFGAALDETLARNPTPSLFRKADRARYYDREFIREDGSTEIIPAEVSKLLTKQEAEERYGLEGLLQFEDNTPEPVARELHDLKIEEQIRRYKMERSGIGLGANLTAGLLGSLVDPLNIASAFIPVVGEARYAALAARMGVPAARMVRGAAEGFTGAALLEPIVYAGALEEQADYTIADSVMNLTFGTLIGGGLHVGAGYVGDKIGALRAAPEVVKTFEDMPLEDKRAVIATAVSQMESGRPVDITPVLDASRHSTKDRVPPEVRQQRMREYDPETVDRADTLDTEIAVMVNVIQRHQTEQLVARSTSEAVAERMAHLEKQVSDETVDWRIKRDVQDEIDTLRETVGEVSVKFDEDRKRALAEIRKAEKRIRELKQERAALAPRLADAYQKAQQAIAKEQRSPAQGRQTAVSGVGAPVVESPAPRAAATPAARPDSLEPANVRAYIEAQNKPYVSPEMEVGKRHAAEALERARRSPEDLDQVLSDVEADIKDIEQMLTPEDYAGYDAAPVEGAATAAQIAQMEKELPVITQALREYAMCANGRL